MSVFTRSMAERTCMRETKSCCFSLTFRKRKGCLLVLLLFCTFLLLGSYMEMVYIIQGFSLSVSIDVIGNIQDIDIDRGSLASLEQQRLEQQRRTGGKDKLIVWYNAAKRHWNTSFTGFLNCGLHRCKISQNPDHVKLADGVIVNAFYLKPNERPPKHNMKQIWIFYCKEPPPNLYYVKFPAKNWGKVFNWTLTYRVDSDFVFPYGAVYQRRKPVKRDWLQIAREKNNSVAWFVGNCKTSSRREDYVKKLQTYGIKVDIYGRCGKFRCPKRDEHECLKQYRFYLAFENSFCSDYVTEKFFKTFQNDIIPVVRGGANYSHLFPKEFIINTADFTKIKDLANYLLRLDRNITEYAAYLQKKAGYRIGYPQPWCDICNRLYDIPKYKKTYYDIDEWLRRKPCYDPTDI